MTQLARYDHEDTTRSARLSIVNCKARQEARASHDIVVLQIMQKGAITRSCSTYGDSNRACNAQKSHCRLQAGRYQSLPRVDLIERILQALTAFTTSRSPESALRIR